MTNFQGTTWFVEHDVRPWALHGIIPAALFWVLLEIVSRRNDRRTASAVVLLGVALCVALAPYAWTTWSDPAPSEQVRARFAPWRRAIPSTAQVLAPGVPVIPWFLLDRPSYWTLRQMAGFMFSRRTAMELQRREYVVHHFPQAPTAAGVLDGMCGSDPQIGFIVTPVDMGPSPFQAIAVGTGRPEEFLHLYSCADHREEGAPRPHPVPQSAN